MPIYEYQAVASQGKRRKGHIEAQSEKEARLKLRDQGMLIVELKEKRGRHKKRALQGEDLLSFTIQLSQLVNAGVPLYESLVALEEQSREESYHSTLLSLCEQVHSGHSLSVAMGHYPDSFDRLYRGMVASGEAVGGLGPVLEKLAGLLGRQMKIRKQIGTALIYPAVLGSFSCLIIGVLLGFVVPSLEGLFADRTLNGFTQGVIAVSHFFRNYGLVFFPVLIGFIVWGIWKLRSPAGRRWRERVVLRLPVIRRLAIQTAVARFCRTMGTLLQGGVNMIDSLRISREVMHNYVLEKEVLAAEQRVIEGRPLSKELMKSSYIPRLVSKMLSVGEESGTSVVMFHRIAEIYEQELEKTLDRIMAMAQPVILIVMGLIIGTVLLAILLPLTDVSAFSAS